MAELEIGMGSAPMAVYEEESEEVNGIVQCKKNPATDDCLIKDWCDADRFPLMNRGRCLEGKKLPIAVFQTSGRIFLTALLSVRTDGLISAEAGISATEGDDGLAVDADKTYFTISVLENNTIVPDRDLAGQYQKNMDAILAQYLFGTDRAIRLKLPARLPLEAFCGQFKDELCEARDADGEPREDLCKVCQCLDNERSGDDCDPVETFQDLWDNAGVEDFGVEGFTLVDPLVGLTGGDLGETRYLTIGAGLDIDFTDE